MDSRCLSYTTIATIATKSKLLLCYSNRLSILVVLRVQVYSGWMGPIIKVGPKWEWQIVAEVWYVRLLPSLSTRSPDQMERVMATCLLIHLLLEKWSAFVVKDLLNYMIVLGVSFFAPGHPRTLPWKVLIMSTSQISSDLGVLIVSPQVCATLSGRPTVIGKIMDDNHSLEPLPIEHACTLWRVTGGKYWPSYYLQLLYFFVNHDTWRWWMLQ